MLRKVDFTAAELQGAALDNADLRGAKFDCDRSGKYCAQLQGASFDGALLRDVSLVWANLQKASLEQADLQGANLDHAQLEGASLKGAQLQGASLRYAVLRSACLDAAQLQGTSLNDAQLQGASFAIAKLQGAFLNGAKLHGANFRAATLLGASLDDAELQGVSLWQTQLQGASFLRSKLQGALFDRTNLQAAQLDNAELQGTSLDGSDVQGASFRKIFAWRADVRRATAGDTRVFAPETGRKQACFVREAGPDCRESSPREQCRTFDVASVCDWSADSFNQLVAILEKVRYCEASVHDETVARIKEKLDPTMIMDGDDEMAKAWAAFKEVPPVAYDKALAGQWREIGCDVSNGPYVVRSLLRQLRYPGSSPFAAQSQQPSLLAAAFLNEADCPGARGLSNVDKEQLQEIRDSRAKSPTGDRRRPGGGGPQPSNIQ
jgi:uncharacterized protein YjbI with pentapeptide repeats